MGIWFGYYTMGGPLKISFSGSDIPSLFIALLFLPFLGVLMDMFQTPFLPEPSPLEDSEEQFEAFCRKSGVCSSFSQSMEFHPLFPIGTSHQPLL